MNRFTLFVTTLLLLLAVPTASSRDLTRREPDQLEEEQQQQHATPLAGGYQHVENVNDNPMVQEAATFCLQAMQTEQPYGFGSQATSVQIIDAWQQVVQGINFQLTLLFVGDNDENDENDCVGAASVLVYNKFGALSITNWNKEISCEEAAVMMKDDSEGEEN